MSGIVTVCPHVERSADAVHVLSEIPQDAHYVTCPCCHQWGWQADSDRDPMHCPECAVPAVTAQPGAEHCYTPSWCKCPDDPMCRLCKQGRCPVENVQAEEPKHE